MPLPVRKSTYCAHFFRNLLAKFVKAPGDKSHNFETTETKETETTIFFGFFNIVFQFQTLIDLPFLLSENLYPLPVRNLLENFVKVPGDKSH